MREIRRDPLLGCRIWTGATNSKGYPVMKVRGRTEYVRRVLWQRERGTIAPGYELRSTCLEKLCVNLAHLELIEANARRRLPRRRSSRAAGR